MNKGDKVICIDNSNGKAVTSEICPLIKDTKIYTIIKTDMGNIMVDGDTLHFWCTSRFRKVEDNFGEEVLENIKQQIKESELQLV